jgi:hypothetical protein
MHRVEMIFSQNFGISASIHYFSLKNTTTWQKHFFFVLRLKIVFATQKRNLSVFFKK